GGQAGGVGELSLILGPVGHRAAGVQEQRRAEVRLLLVLADVEAVALAEDPPVDVADLVAGDVLPVLLELDAVALLRRAVQARAEAVDDDAGEDLQAGDLPQVPGGQEFVDVRHEVFADMTRSTMSSTVMPSASALKVGTMRWRRTGLARAFMSSTV